MQWLVVLLGYLIGSFPTAYAVSKKLTGEDIRRLGDRNMGARNAYHEIGHRAGVLIFFVDAAKGYIAIQIAHLSGTPQYIVLATGLAAMAGHNFPFFLRFRGGRGESTAIGIYFALVPIPMLIVAVPTFISLLVWKNVIFTSAVLFISLPFICWWFRVPGLVITYVCILPFIVALTHLFRVRGWRKITGTGTA